MNDVWRRSAPGMTLALLVLFPMSAAAQSDAEPWSLPRTAAGVPDLNGVWDFRTITPMERPDSLAGKAVLTDEEAASLEEQTGARTGFDKAPPPGQTGTYNRFWVDYGTSVVDSPADVVDCGSPKRADPSPDGCRRGEARGGEDEASRCRRARANPRWVGRGPWVQRLAATLHPGTQRRSADGARPVQQLRSAIPD